MTRYRYRQCHVGGRVRALPRAALPGPEQVIRSAQTGGVELWSVPSRDGMPTFEMAGGGSVVVALMPAPIPDVLRMPVGPLSPPPCVIFN